MELGEGGREMAVAEFIIERGKVEDGAVDIGICDADREDFVNKYSYRSLNRSNGAGRIEFKHGRSEVSREGDVEGMSEPSVLYVDMEEFR